MSRFLEIDNIGTSAGDQAIYLLNMDLITSIVDSAATFVKIPYRGNSGNTAGGNTQYIEITCNPAFGYNSNDDSLVACILGAMETSTNAINAVVKLSDFLPTGTTITGIEFAD
jgi:hypothetical protein